MTNKITKQPGLAAIAVISALSMMSLPVMAGEMMSTSCPKLLDHHLTSLQENSVDLCQYSGRVVLFVNTASFCANTPQYAKLEKLYEDLQPRGLTVVGFPANDFGEQEPGDNKEIAKFCKLTYKVKFPMMEKSGVKKENANPVFKQLIAATGEAPEWNFHKYLVSRDGNTVLSFAALLQPDDPKFMQAIELLLAQPANK